MGKRITFVDLHRSPCVDGQSPTNRARELQKHLTNTGAGENLCGEFVHRMESEQAIDGIGAATCQLSLDDALLVELVYMLVTEAPHGDHPAQVVSAAMYQGAFKRLGRQAPDLALCAKSVQDLRALWWALAEFKRMQRFDPSIRPMAMHFNQGNFLLLFDYSGTEGSVRIELEDLRKLTAIRQAYPVEQFYAVAEPA